MDILQYILMITPIPHGCPWSEFRRPTIQFCEANLCSWITAPANTWSNLPYIFFGIWLVYRGFRSQELIAKIIGSVAIIVGICSFGYHASFTFIGQFFDLSSLFFLAAMMLVFNLRRLGVVQKKAQVPLFLAVGAMSMIILAILNKAGQTLFGLELAIALGIDWKISRKFSGIEYRDLLTALAIFISGFVIWVLDVTKVACDPNNHFVQGHAIWHLMTSFCFPLLYRFYRQFEENDQSQIKNSSM